MKRSPPAEGVFLVPPPPPPDLFNLLLFMLRLELVGVLADLPGVMLLLPPLADMFPFREATPNPPPPARCGVFTELFRLRLANDPFRLKPCSIESIFLCLFMPKIKNRLNGRN